MQTSKQKNRSIGGNVLIALAMLLVFVVSGLSSFYLLGGFHALGIGRAPLASVGRSVATPGHIVEGQVKALRLSAPTETSADAIQAYFDAAVAYAGQAGLNTIIFEAKTGGEAWWQDGYFQTPATLEKGCDPLALLCDAASGTGIQLFVNLDLYASEGDAQLPQNAAYYSDDLLESLASLAKYYSISGIIFSGFFAGIETTDADRVAFSLQFEKLLGAAASSFSADGRVVRMGIEYASSSGLMDQGFAQSLATGGLATWLLPLLDESTAQGETTAAQPDAPTIATAAHLSAADLFLAARNVNYAGAVFANLPGDTLADTLLLTSALESPNSVLPGGFSIAGELAITYPAEGAQITTAGVFIMGTSDPAQPLYLDGQQVEVLAENGYFGVYVALEDDLSSFTFTQGEQSLTLNVARGASSGGSDGSGGTSGGVKTDPPAQVGDLVRITDTIGTAYTASGGINETFPQGATFVVADTVATTSGGSYMLASGDYVAASSCETVGNGSVATFTGITLQAQADGSELLVFEGSGSPAAYVSYGNEDGVLALTFYDTSITLASSPSGNLLSAASVQQNAEDGTTTLTLQTNNLWGYSLEYVDGGTQLYLMAAPKISTTAGKPLEGVRILLDPGHGLDDYGSRGLMWDRGPYEKDLNLNLAQAIAYRLRQLGAEVTLTREDDSFPTLQERLQAQTDQKPHFYLSVHHNALEPTADLNNSKGVEAFYYHPYSTPPSQQFAQNLLDYVAAETGRNPRQVDWNYFYVTRTTVCPSVLFEYGFLMCPTEFDDVTSEEGIWRAAFGTADAILATIPA